MTTLKYYNRIKLYYKNKSIEIRLGFVDIDLIVLIVI